MPTLTFYKWSRRISACNQDDIVTRTADQVVILHIEPIAKLHAQPPKSLGIGGALGCHLGWDGSGGEAPVGAAAVDVASDDIRGREYTSLGIFAKIDDFGDGVLTTNHVGVGLAAAEDEIRSGLRRAKNGSASNASIVVGATV